MTTPMNRTFHLGLALCAFVALHPPTLFAAQPTAGQSTASQAPTVLSAKQLEKLVQPIALYPDLLLQQTLAASTFPEQLLDAALYNEQGKAPALIKDQPWDDSVKAIANYPSVLTMLAKDLDWTISLGGAFINQSQDLITAIQTLRARAKAVGNLKDSSQQNVIEEQGAAGNTIIIIEPVQPTVVYVPTTTTVVYEKPVPTSTLWVPLATFGLGLALGSAMSDHDDHYYYGGSIYGPAFWRGGPAVNNWVDYRQDRWDDAYDFARDRQDFRQDNWEDQREHRQELARKQQEWRNEQNRRPASMSPEQRAKASTRTNEARARLESSGAAAARGVDRSQANERLNAARSNPQLQQRAANVRNNPATQQRAEQVRNNRSAGQAAGRSSERGAGLSGLGSSGRTVNREQARGSASRARSGGGGGMRGGGGGMRGGGGRRR